MSTDLADQVIDAAESILSNIDSDAGQSFAESIKEKAESIKETIESMEARGLGATDAQTTALQNMLNGAERWLEHQN